MKQIILLLLKQFHGNCHSKAPRCRKISHSSDMQNDALMHREGSKVEPITASNG